MTQSRYPGAKPFTVDEAKIFFGRKQDTLDLYRLIRQEPLTVLYAKSGLGKSSLLNAGIVPKIIEEGTYVPVTIRFLSYKNDGNHSSPIATTMERIKIHKSNESTYLDKLIENESTLWHDLKEQQILDADQNNGLLLIFDQFEELFTYPPEQQLAFRKQIAEALNTPLPQRYWDVLDLYTKEDMPFTQNELAQLQKPVNVRVIFSIREDRVHLLGSLADYLPTISKNWFKLDALDEKAATDAIVEPAFKAGNFISPPFTYTNEALVQIIHFLTDEGKEKIEGTQLQIVCNSIEQKVNAQGIKLVDKEAIGNLESIIENFYEEKIKTISDPVQQLAARRLVEEGLIFEEEERRLSMYEGQILKSYQIDPVTLKALVDSHLLRAEPSMKGGYTYELSHDSLVSPVLKAKEKRLVAEKQVEAERLRNEQQQALAEARAEAERERQRAEEQAQLRTVAENNEKKAKRRTQLALIISVFALALAAFAGVQFMSAKLARASAEESLTLAKQKEEEAKHNLTLLTQEQAKKFEAQYDAFMANGRALMAQSDYVGASREFASALEFKENDSEALKLKTECESKSNTKQRFDDLIKKGDAYYNSGSGQYVNALEQYRAALEQNYNNNLANSKINNVSGKLETAFNKFVNDGDKFYKANGYEYALQNYKKALRIKPGDSALKQKIKDCESKLK